MFSNNENERYFSEEFGGFMRSIESYWQMELEKIQRAKRVNDVNERDENTGYTVLHAAFRRGDMQLVDYLLSIGGDVRIKCRKGYTLLHTVATTTDTDKYIEPLKFLLKNGLDINDTSNEYGLSPLHFVALCGNKSAMEIWLEHGADLTIRSKFGDNIFHYATRNKCDGVLRMLLKFGKFDVNSRLKNGATPLHIATYYVNPPNLKILLKYGADVNIANDYNNTALNFLVESSKIRMREFVAAYYNAPPVRSMGEMFELWKKSREKDDEARNLMARHFAILAQLRQPICQGNIMCISTDPVISKHFRECKSELERMSEKTLYGSITFFNALVSHTNVIARYVRNKDFLQAFESFESYYSNEFPNYYDTLKEKINDGLEKHELLTRAATKLENCIFFKIVTITERIFVYLSDQDLQNICSS